MEIFERLELDSVKATGWDLRGRVLNYISVILAFEFVRWCRATV
jgi:hypothetical protein